MCHPKIRCGQKNSHRLAFGQIFFIFCCEFKVLTKHHTEGVAHQINVI